MAQKKGNVPAAVGHAAIGTLPIGGAQYEGYKAGRTAGMGKGASVAVGAATTVVPFSGTAAGAYHGYHSGSANGRRSTHQGRANK